MPTSHMLIKGKVQGVFYRATAKNNALKLKLTGWIKNTKEGDVEVTVTGKEEPIQEFIIWCKLGPETAEVTEVIVTQQTETTFSGFNIVT